MHVNGKALLAVAVVGLLCLGVLGASPRGAASSGDLMVIPVVVDDQVQMIYVVDRARRSMAVYRMEIRSGRLKLEAARHFGWDLQLEHLDTEAPTPDDVRKMVEAQK